jgi:hypothetical protein
MHIYQLRALYSPLEMLFEGISIRYEIGLGSTSSSGPCFASGMNGPNLAFRFSGFVLWTIRYSEKLDLKDI